MAILVALANGIVKPILNILGFPAAILTLGLFLIITNALLQLVVWLPAPERLDLGIASTSFFCATFLGALVISLVRFIAEQVVRAD